LSSTTITLAGSSSNMSLKGVRGAIGAHRVNLVERDRIELGAEAGQRQQRLHLGGEMEHAAMAGVEERPDPHSVARQHHAPAARIPYGEGEIAVEALDAGFAHQLVEMQDDLGVARGAEPPAAAAQFLAQLDMVEDLAIEGDDEVAAGVAHRLATVGEGDDGKPDMGEPCLRRDEDALVVRPAVLHGAGHGAQRLLRRRDRAEISAETAHERRPGKWIEALVITRPAFAIG
jgi:hypothetical protein